MRVLYLLPQPKQAGRIGAYPFLDEEIQALATSGVEAFVLSTAAPEDSRCGAVQLVSVMSRTTASSRLKAAWPLVSPVEGLPLRSARHPLLSYRSAWMEHVAARVVEEKAIQLIHSHFAWPRGLGGAMARVVTGRPLVASLRGTDIVSDKTLRYGRRRNPYFGRAVGRLLATADRTVYFSRYMRDQGVSLGARPEATRVIRKGVDLRHFAPSQDRAALRAELGLPSRPMVLTVGGLIPLKGIHHVLEAAALLREGLDVTFVVCGDGPERSRLEAMGAGLGLGDRLVFTGRVDRATISKYFAACDVFVLASLREAAGNVVFEAMASGRPVVCTDSGGPGEYVADGETGFVVPIGDPAAVAASIRRLLLDEELRETMGREARRRTIRDFDYDRMVSDLIDVYREVVQTETGPRVMVS
jgi:glycosyltransferase involved in cell wall biosynthesis